MKFNKDSIYSSPVDEIVGFTFDEEVVSVFPDMIQRSVPGYATIISAIGLLAGRYAQQESLCYDLGCSLGAATISMRHRVPDSCRIVAVDNSEAMIQGCKTTLKNDRAKVPVDLQHADIRDVEIKNASIVVLNFTLQFIPVEDRPDFLGKIYQGLRPGGILILSEKLQFDDPAQQALQTEMHHEFKRANGYSEMEISQKRTALENVLIPETLSRHRERLLKAGFRSAEVWFQYFNFASITALK